jgi:hypothetical protein
MTDFNPLSGAILGSAEIQQQLGVDKQRQLRRAQEVKKNAAARDDQYEHPVESSEELHPVDDGGRDHPEHGRRDQRRPSTGKEDEQHHIDVKA